MKIPLSGCQVYAYTGSRSIDRRQPTVVFLHGAANDHSVWTLQSRYFAHHGYNVLAPDLPGHGLSGGQPLASIGEIADWTRRLLDELGIANVLLVGHSMGSLAALEAASREPSRVQRLAMLGAAVPMQVSDALLAAAHDDEALAHALIVGWSFSAPSQLGGNTQPGLWMIGNGLRLLQRSAPGVLHTDLRACHDYSGGLDAATRVTCPALLIAGGADVMAPKRRTRAVAERLAQVRVVDVPDCGHSMMSEAPDAVLDALREFLG